MGFGDMFNDDPFDPYGFYIAVGLAVILSLVIVFIL